MLTRLSQLFLYLLGAVATAIASAGKPHDGSFYYDHLLIRQAPGTPQFDCHFNCGSTVSGGRIEGHCQNSTWTELYWKCLDCALEFNIWSIYGKSVGSAGQICGLGTTPSPSGLLTSVSSTVAGSSSAATPTDVSTVSSTATTPSGTLTTPAGSSGGGGGGGGTSTSARTSSPTPAGAPGTKHVPGAEILVAVGVFMAVYLFQ